jgi:hypothetical protein
VCEAPPLQARAEGQVSSIEAPVIQLSDSHLRALETCACDLAADVPERCGGRAPLRYERRRESRTSTEARGPPAKKMQAAGTTGSAGNPVDSIGRRNTR